MEQCKPASGEAAGFSSLFCLAQGDIAGRMLFFMTKLASMHRYISTLMSMHFLEQRDFRVFSCLSW
jgi:hypothetical protein